MVKVKTIKKQNKDSLFRKPKANTNKNKNKNKRCKTMRKRKIKIKKGGGPNDCIDHDVNINRVLRLEHDIANNMAKLDALTQDLQYRNDRYYKNMDVNSENHTANLTRGSELLNEMNTIRGKTIGLIRTQNRLLAKIPKHVQEACQLRESIRRTKVAATDLEAFDYV
jgi:hypothetical protein